MNNDTIRDFFLYHVILFLDAIKDLVPIGLFFACILAGCIILNKVIIRRAERIMFNWVKDKQYQLIFYKRRRTARIYCVFYIEVITPSGQLKKGYIRCGDLLFGIFVDTVDVSWEE